MQAQKDEKAKNEIVYEDKNIVFSMEPGSYLKLRIYLKIPTKQANKFR
jgi:hypothetical protein